MTKNINLFLLSAIMLFSSLKGFSQEKAIGNWSGELKLPGAKLEIIFKVNSSEDNILSATMDVPQQGASGINADRITATNDSLILEISMINGTFKGAFTDSLSLEGNWNQNGMNFPLTLEKKENVTELKRPQTPEKPYPYIEEEVTFTNNNDGVSLSGTLTIPNGEGKFPAVVLITGSGAQDRDETIYGHKPFLVLADHLTRNGFAVLRTDDRGVGGSKGDIKNVTSKELAGDVLAGVKFLNEHKKINGSKIGLVGHSEGGLIAPIAATISNDVNFIIMWAGPGINGKQILYDQAELINRTAGMPEGTIKNNKELQENIFQTILEESNHAKAKEKLQQIFSHGMWDSLKENQKAAIFRQIEEVNTTWFRFFLKYDPYVTLTKVKCPVLALIGEKDLQVPPAKNLEAIKNALQVGANKNYKVEELKNLNHFFQNCETGAISEYGKIEETIAPKALKTMTDWLLKVTK